MPECPDCPGRDHLAAAEGRQTTDADGYVHPDDCRCPPCWNHYGYCTLPPTHDGPCAGGGTPPCPAMFRVGVLRRVRCQREAGHDGWHVQSVEWKSPPARKPTDLDTLQ